MTSAAGLGRAPFVVVHPAGDERPRRTHRLAPAAAGPRHVQQGQLDPHPREAADGPRARTLPPQAARGHGLHLKRLLIDARVLSVFGLPDFAESHYGVLRARHPALCCGPLRKNHARRYAPVPSLRSVMVLSRTRTLLSELKTLPQALHLKQRWGETRPPCTASDQVSSRGEDLTDGGSRLKQHFERAVLRDGLHAGGPHTGGRNWTASLYVFIEHLGSARRLPPEESATGRKSCALES